MRRTSVDSLRNLEAARLMPAPGLSDPVVEPLAAVRNLAIIASRQRDVDLTTAGLRLFEPTDAIGTSSDIPHPSDEAGPLVSPFDLGRTYELLLAPQTRRKSGAHLTPELIARRLVAMLPALSTSDVVLDPAVGGAAFLLAAADRVLEDGADPHAVVDQLVGVDLDPGAVAVAEAAIVLWGVDHGVDPRPLPNITVGDGLLVDLPSVDVVVGNPPFLNQLRNSSTHSAERRAALRDRWGELIGTYTDDAWIFLAAALDALRPGGSLALLQPVSILAARHADAVRRRVQADAAMTGLWVGRDRVFDAAVQVCGIVLNKQAAPQGPVDRRVGADFAAASPLPNQPAAEQWGSAAAATLDIPTVHIANDVSGTVADLAHVTAGFRDQFYGFVPYVAEAQTSADAPSNTMPRLVTVGMIDVLGLSWGRRASRFAKRTFVRPVVDLTALQRDDSALGEWALQRRRPKLLMATQTRVVEVWVDDQGFSIPATPVVSIEPFDDDPTTLWMLAAALSAPALSAQLLAAKFGTALSLNSMKLASRDVLAAPLPTDTGAWSEAAALIRDAGDDGHEPALLASFAEMMSAAYGNVDRSLVRWWLDRATNNSDTR